MEKKISELEYAFTEAFKNAIGDIANAAEHGEPMTLRDVLNFGFNNVDLDGKIGFEIEDFTEKELSTKVDFNFWDEDMDGYRVVYLTEIL